ncbi:FliM/FliN family flagellar motor switch protein [Candidatus Fukatsuia symbiotica]|nr:FliM/FliN family flagellar motor switch protein [Candidatus Fukatsuia symbiotica]MEA9444914.1 FliM/FliN family flagellar motor switch protein [Candidatus Fukatsuia symbiotica]
MRRDILCKQSKGVQLKNVQSKKIKAKIYQGDQLPEVMTLDINKLGRPYNKVPKIISDYFDILDSKISLFFLKKYRVNLSLKNINTEMDCSHKNAKVFSTELGNVAFDTERSFLLSMLNGYYGLSKDNTAVESGVQTSITKTEERLKNKLGIELTQLFLNIDDFGEPLVLKNTHSTFVKKWSYRIIFSLAGDEQHVFYLLLDANHVDRLLRSHQSDDEEEKKAGNNKAALPLEELFNKLPVTLNCRLTSVNLTLAELKVLKEGEIITVSMPERFPVFIGREQMFNATITEIRGKLFLSEFNEKTMR